MAKAKATAAAASVAPPGGRAKKAKGQGKNGQLALQNGGVGDGSGGKAACSLGVGKSICFAWNNGATCKVNPCVHIHVCQICESPDHNKTNCPKK